MSVWLSLIFVSFTLNHANALNCMEDFKAKLSLFSSKPHLNSTAEYQKQRLSFIFPQLYTLPMDEIEKLELTRTLEQLELLNNKKKLFSVQEEKFSIAYNVFNKKGLSPVDLHDYFRSIARGDLESAGQEADLILSRVDEMKRPMFSEVTGIYGSKSNFWKTYKKVPEIETTLIKYADHANNGAAGFRVTSELTQAQKFKIVELTQAMEDLHGVYVASVPEAIERLSSNGFSIRKAEFKPFHGANSETIEGPMIIVPQNDLLFDRISSTTRHEARHAKYGTLREQFSTSPFDVSVHSVDKSKPLGTALGYQMDQSYEEVSTHAKDLLYSTRTGNREILNLYKKNPVLLANEVFDLSFLENKNNTVIKMSEQTARTAKDAVEEIQRQMKLSYQEVADVGVAPSKEGYVFGFKVKDAFMARVTFSSKAEKAVVKDFVDKYTKFQDELKIATEKGLPVSEELAKSATESLNLVFQGAEEKLSQSITIANQTKADAHHISELIEGFYKNGMEMSREKYLEARGLISKPAARVTGLVVRDPEEYKKTIQFIKEKRAQRRTKP